MKKILILASLVLIMSACATPCCWCQNNDSIKWQQFESDCVILYNKITSDLDSVINSNDNTLNKEYYQQSLTSIKDIYNNNIYKYDALLDIINCLYTYNYDYLNQLKNSKEYINYNKWKYNQWFNGAIKTLKYKP